jgi:hypothetical protein
VSETATDEPGTEVEAAPAVEQVGQAIERSSGQPDLDASARLGTWLAAAESGSQHPNALAMGAALRIEYARLLGLPPHAASEVHVIKGNLTLSSKLLRALAHSDGLRVERIEGDNTFCTAAVVRLKDEHELGRVTYTIEQARQQGLLAKKGETWKQIPDRMLWARAAKRALDDYAPWVTVGIITEDEAEDIDLVPRPFDSDEVLVGTIEDDE